MKKDKKKKEEEEIPVAKFKVLQPIDVLDEEGEPTGEQFEVGSIQEVPVELGVSWVDLNLAERAEDEVPEKPKKGAKKEKVEEEQVEETVYPIRKDGAFEMENGEELPLTHEGHAIDSIGARKEAGENVFYSCKCDDNCTYDVPILG